MLVHFCSINMNLNFNCKKYKSGYADFNTISLNELIPLFILLVVHFFSDRKKYINFDHIKKPEEEQ